PAAGLALRCQHGPVAGGHRIRKVAVALRRGAVAALGAGGAEVRGHPAGAAGEVDDPVDERGLGQDGDLAGGLQGGHRSASSPLCSSSASLSPALSPSLSPSLSASLSSSWLSSSWVSSSWVSSGSASGWPSGRQR